MTSPLFRADLIARVRGAVSRAHAARYFEHHGLAGTAREIFVQDLLRPVMPPLVQIGAGKISDHLGTLSRECDVILYSTGTLPPLSLAPEFGMYPVDAALYCIEVKSTLTKAEVQDAINKKAALDEMQLLMLGTPRVNSALFAYGSNLKKQSELDRYRRLDPQADSNPAMVAICVAGKGYWRFERTSTNQGNWLFHEPTSDHDEIVDFICGVANTVPKMIALKGMPPIGMYFIQDRPMQRI